MHPIILQIPQGTSHSGVGLSPPLTPSPPPGSALLGGAGGTEEGKNERNKGEALAHFPISHMRPQDRDELNIKPLFMCVCFITAGPITKLFAGGEEESGGHVL